MGTAMENSIIKRPRYGKLILPNVAQKLCSVAVCKKYSIAIKKKYSCERTELKG